MYRKTEKEFQYHPGIEKVLMDVIGGGTIDRSDLDVSFLGVQLKELPPLTIVGKDSGTGVYHVVKTAKVHADAADADTDYPVKKNHLFKVGDKITASGLAEIANTISAIDKSNADYDVITVASTLDAVSEGDVLVLANADAAAGSAAYKYTPECITMNKVDLTVANQQSGLLEAGKVNESVMPFPIDTALKAKLDGIRFV
jgi:hypothetical protein